MKWLHKFLGEGPFIVGSIKSNFCIDRRRAMTGCKLFLSRKNVLSVKKHAQSRQSCSYKPMASILVFRNAVGIGFK